MRRKDAEHYIAEGRAVWLSMTGEKTDQLRLNMVHGANQRAAAGYQWPAHKVPTARELLNIGIVRPHTALGEGRNDSPNPRQPQS